MAIEETMDPSSVAQFFTLFTPNKDGYGVTTYKEWDDEKHKQEVVCKRVLETPSLSTVNRHLVGAAGIGFAPLLDDNTCYWAAIDADNISPDRIRDIVTAIEHLDLPCVPCYSKSRSLHIYFFFPEPEPADEVRDYLVRFVGRFNLPEATEIFPKQIYRSTIKFPSWINLPYFGDQRHMIQMQGSDCTQVSLGTFLQTAKARRLSIAEANKKLNATLYWDAPPCVRSGAMFLNITENRNAFLFSTVVYLRNRLQDPEQVRDQILSLNSLLPSPLPLSEVQNTVAKAIENDKYFYKCDQMTCCNKNECETTPYGIGGNKGQSPDIQLGELVRIMTNPPSYRWEVNGKTITFASEDELISQNKFISACMRQLNILLVKMKPAKWARILNKHLASIREEAPSIEVNEYDLLMACLPEYIWRTPRASSLAGVLADSFVYLDDSSVYFTLSGFIAYLKNTHVLPPNDRSTAFELIPVFKTRGYTEYNGIIKAPKTLIEHKQKQNERLEQSMEIRF